MEKITIEQLQSNFDSIMENVEDGQMYEIEYENGNCILMPHSYYEEVDDLIRIHTELNNEAS